MYLAHLSDEERQFVVTLVLSKVVTWMRGLPGTTDLRALVYMDEVFGYVPPTAAPPSKKPILTLLKQGRAFGVGTVLATQNPVDLDYKAMSNAGTWLVGRLQTERDKARVLEGLRSAAGDTDVDALSTAVGGLEKRQFLLVSAHEPEPVLFSTRWAMSYLRGPLTKEQIADADGGRAAAGAGRRAGGRRDRRARRERRRARGRRRRPGALCRPRGAVARGGRRNGRRGAGCSAFLAARVSVRFDDTKAGVDVTEEWEALYGPLDETLDLESETRGRARRPRLPGRAADGASYVLPAAPIAEERFFREAQRSIQRRLVDLRTLEIFRNPALRLYSRPGETEEAFLARADQAAQAKADEETARIRDRLEAKQDRLEAALETARRRAEELESEQRSRWTTEVIAGAGSVLGVLLGGRASTKTIARAGRAAGSAASRRGMSDRAGERRRTAEEKAEATEEALAELEQEILDEVAEIDAKWDERRARDRDGRGPRRRRPTSASPSWPSSGCRRPDPRARRSRCCWPSRAAPRTHGAPEVESGRVARVADGDTLRLADGRRVRLVQIDAPEPESECFGQQATRVLSELAPPGTPLELERDPRLDDADRFGRLLRYASDGRPTCSTSCSSSAARRRPTSSAAPGAVTADELEEAAAAAKAARRGLWGVCPGARLDPERALADGAALSLC